MKVKINRSWICWSGGTYIVIPEILAKRLLKEGDYWRYGRYEIAANKSHPKNNPGIDKLRESLNKPFKIENH